MLDYTLNFYNNYSIIFYILLVIAVILEWPITIFTISLLATRFGFPFVFVLFFAFIWEFLWDLLHYFIWRLFKKNIFKDKKFILFEKIEKKLENHSLFDKVAVIKYTPPITSIWFLYLGFQKINIKSFIKNILILAILNSLIITLLWYNFWKLFINKDDFKYIIFWLMFSFLILYFFLKIISFYFVKNILKNGAK